MCNFLGFRTEEMIGRSLNLLHGPKTDAKALTGAIKNTGLLTSAQFFTTLYSRDGSELGISALCVPYFGEGGVLSGCKLQLLPEENGFANPALSSRNSNEAATERLEQAVRDKRACYRSRHNFCTGLAIQRSMMHHAESRSPPQGAADAWPVNN